MTEYTIILSIVVFGYCVILAVVRMFNSKNIQLSYIFVPDLDESKKADYLNKKNIEWSALMGIKPPPIYIELSEDDNVTSFNTPWSRYIRFQSKSLKNLDAEALASVLAHELYHIKELHERKNMFMQCMFFILAIFINIQLLDWLDHYSFYAKLDNPQNLIFGALYTLFSLTSLWGLSIVCKQLSDIVSAISSRAQEIECDQFAVKMNGINNFLKQANYYDASQYFKNRKKSIWLNIKYFFTDTHPSWSKRKLSAIKFNRQYRSLSESLIPSHDQ